MPVLPVQSSVTEPVADLEGGRAGSALPPLGDGLTPSLTVLLICDNGTILWLHHRHFYLFKHVLQRQQSRLRGRKIQKYRIRH